MTADIGDRVVHLPTMRGGVVKGIGMFEYRFCLEVRLDPIVVHDWDEQFLLVSKSPRQKKLRLQGDDQ